MATKHNIAVSTTAVYIPITDSDTEVTTITITSGSIDLFVTFNGVAAVANADDTYLVTSTMHAREFITRQVAGGFGISVIATGAGTISVETE